MPDGMIILVINCGSSSIKYQVFDMGKSHVLCKGLVENIGLKNPRLIHEKGQQKLVETSGIKDHEDAIRRIIGILTDPVNGVVDDIGRISAIGHRVGHGGEKILEPALIDEKNLAAIKENVMLAPIHMPHMVRGIETFQKLLPNIPMVAVMDTSFHQTMPEHAYVYSIPYEYYQKHGIRRYGFHGTSHKYVTRKAAQLLNKRYGKMKIVSCHLGSGSSITAVCNGVSVDTSMGFTPITGIPMGTRSGDIDPCIVGYIMKKEKIGYAEVEKILNQRSGLIGVSGISSDFREVESYAMRGNDRAKLAIEIFCYAVKKYIGAYAAAMGGLDCVVFTGGIGENSDSARKKICTGLGFIGVELDPVKNIQSPHGTDVDRILSKNSSNVQVCLVHTNEEYMIAVETMNLIGMKTGNVTKKTKSETGI